MLESIGQVFNALVGRPVLNLLIIIIALLPGHNLGVAIIIFTVIIRLALYPLLKKQLHHAMAMRKLQPEIKKLKKAAAGDKQKEMQLLTELYKEREVKPFASIGILLAQLPILLALFHAVNGIIKDPQIIVNGAYGWVKSLPFIEQLAADPTKLDTTFLGINLTHTFYKDGGIGILMLVVASVVVQYYQSKQLMMTDKSSRSLRQILKDSSQGKEVDQSEVQAATSKFTLYIIPIMLFIVAINLPAALSLYWLAGSIIATMQQRYILSKDVEEMELIANSKPVKVASKKTSHIKEAEIIEAEEAATAEPTKKIDKKTGVKTYIKTESSPISSNKNTKTNKKTHKKSKKRR